MTAPDILALRTIRAEDPEAVSQALLRRTRRPLLGADGKLCIIAADHPARGALGVGTRRLAMADRDELLRRLVVALDRPGVDGVLGTADIIDDLALLGALDDKLVVGSVNRGGLQGAVFEMDDRLTGYRVSELASQGLDLGKLLLRINLHDPGTARTLELAREVVDESVEHRLPIMVEVFMSQWHDGRVVNDLSTEAVIRSVAIAAGLGSSSSRTWLKLPVVAEMERVSAASTLPILLLGGDAGGDPGDTYLAWQAALALPGVRGLVVGRSLLYPHDDDVAAAVDIAAALVHGTTGHAAR